MFVEFRALVLESMQSCCEGEWVWAGAGFEQVCLEI